MLLCSRTAEQRACRHVAQTEAALHAGGALAGPTSAAAACRPRARPLTRCCSPGSSALSSGARSARGGGHLGVTAGAPCRGAASSARARTASAAEAGRSVESKYAAEYERGLDPFSAFQGRALMSSKARMNIADKLVLGLGSAVVSNKWARLAAVGYAVVMHALMFVVLFRVSHRHHEALAACGGLLPHRTGQPGAIDGSVKTLPK